MATLITETDSARAMRLAMEFSIAMDEGNAQTFDSEPTNHCAVLLRYLGSTLLGWGRREVVGEEVTYNLYMGGVESDEIERRFYADWCIRKPDGSAVINGGLMFRDNEWTVHT